MKPIVWLASFPKSGNTWVRLLLTNLQGGEARGINAIGIARGLASSRKWFDEACLVASGLLSADECDAMRPALYRHVAQRRDQSVAEGSQECGHGEDDPLRQWLFVKTHDAWTRTIRGEPLLGGAEAARAAVLIVRDPRDVVASFANHNNSTLEQAVALMGDPESALAVKADRQPLQLRQQLLGWSGFHRSWLDQSEVPVHLVRYEDLQADTAGTLRTLLGQPVMPASADLLTADFDSDLPREWLNFLAECALQGVTVVHFKQLRQSLTGQVQTEHLSENADGALAPSANYIALKRMADGLLALALLPVLVPLFVVVAAAIRVDSPGPVFFRQVRVGYRGRPFAVWKFRTMRAGPASDQMPQSDDPRERAITREDDPRITPLGRFLRRTRIDELPQVINVLRGEMSWIGPRPEALELSRWYETELPFYRYRHVVRPGISGWAQVSQGHVADLDDVLKKLNFDFFYISRFSLWLDVLIVLRTIKTMLTGFGSR